MKKYSILFAFLMAFINAHTQTYNITLTRGHGIDDIYLDMYQWNYPTRSIYHITDFGSAISRSYSYGGDHSFYSLIADPTPGILVGSLPSDFNFIKSTDYGETWSKLPNLDTVIGWVFGGSIAEEYYYLTWRGPNTNSIYSDKLFYSTNFSSNLIPVQDSCIGFEGETGVVPGELYCRRQSQSSGKYYFARSNDYGLNFDSIPVNDSIANANDGKYLMKISRGVSEGEIFLVTLMVDIASSGMFYSIYRTTDYGNAWELKSQKVFYGDGLQDFTAGRDSCSFYYIDYDMDYNGNPVKLSVFYSDDCGETFTPYEHLLTPDVGLKEVVKEGTNKINIAPNPATNKINLSYQFANPSEIVISVYNSLGQCVLYTTPSWEAGSIKKTINIENLKQGFYSVQIQSAGSAIATGKFIISR